MLIAGWLLLALGLLWGLGAYNRLMRLRNAIAQAWAQLEPALTEIARGALGLADGGAGWLPAESAAFEALRQAAEGLQAAVAQLARAPHQAEASAQLAVAVAVLAAALQRVRSLLALNAHDDDDAGRQALLDALKTAEAQRDFGRQLFNQRVQAFNEALAEWPTRVLAGPYGFHDAGRF